MQDQDQEKYPSLRKYISAPPEPEDRLEFVSNDPPTYSESWRNEMPYEDFLQFSKWRARPIRSRSKAKTVARHYRKATFGDGNPACEVCGWSLPRNSFEKAGGTQLHHIRPVSQGGTDDQENLISLCPNHHSSCHYLYRFMGKNQAIYPPKKTLILILRTMEQDPKRFLDAFASRLGIVVRPERVASQSNESTA